MCLPGLAITSLMDGEWRMILRRGDSSFLYRSKIGGPTGGEALLPAAILPSWVVTVD